jgi:hypothetical protein
MASPKGAAQIATWTFPIIGGTYDAATNRGVIKAAGIVRWHGQVPSAVAPPIGDTPFDVTVENPTIIFDGTQTASFFASGDAANGSGSLGRYSDDAPLFTFDLSGAAPIVDAEGLLSFASLVPTLMRVGTATAPLDNTMTPFFTYKNPGPDRTPNVWGGFTLKLATPQSGPQGVAGVNGSNGSSGAAGADGTDGVRGADGAKGETGAQGPAGKDGAPGAQGAKGKTGTKGKDGRTVVIAYLRKAPFKGSKARKITLLRSGKTVGTGEVKGRRIRVTLRAGKRSLSPGRYTVKYGKTKRSVRVA